MSEPRGRVVIWGGHPAAMATRYRSSESTCRAAEFVADPSASLVDPGLCGSPGIKGPGTRCPGEGSRERHLHKSLSPAGLAGVRDGTWINRGIDTRATAQSQKAVTAYYSSKQLLPFGFADAHTLTAYSNAPIFSFRIALQTTWTP